MELIRMQEEKVKYIDHAHLASVFTLDKDCGVDGNTLIAKLKALEKCSICGQHMPDLAFEFEGRTYVFVCQAIRKGDEIIARTDFPLFMKFLEQLRREGSSIFETGKDAT